MKAEDTVIDIAGLTVGEVGVANQQAEVSVGMARVELVEWLKDNIKMHSYVYISVVELNVKLIELGMKPIEQ